MEANYPHLHYSTHDAARLVSPVRKQWGSCVPLFTFVLGMAVSAAVTMASFGLMQMRCESAASTSVTRVDFSFQVLNVSTPRQLNKTLNVFVKFRYAHDTSRCPFHPTDNTCPQYQLFMREYILNKTTMPTPELPIETEWERVNLAICHGLWGTYPNIAALSTSLQVNGDVSPALWVAASPYQPSSRSSWAAARFSTL